MSSVLLVEDDATLGATLKERLSQEGYALNWARSCAEAREFLARGNVDLLILDIGLPDGSGLDLARDIRISGDTAIVFLSAMSSAEYRLEGFELGADDYIPKPFHLKEFLLRVRRVLERKAPQTVSRIECAGFWLDTSNCSIGFPDGKSEFILRRDFELLALLIKNSSRALSREEILSTLWSGEAQQTGRTIDNAILRLRQILKHAGMDEAIRSVRGVGYQWVAQGA